MGDAGLSVTACAAIARECAVPLELTEMDGIQSSTGVTRHKIITARLVQATRRLAIDFVSAPIGATTVEKES